LFLLTLAIIDDIGAFLVIALFCSSGVQLTWPDLSYSGTRLDAARVAVVAASVFAAAIGALVVRCRSAIIATIAAALLTAARRGAGSARSIGGAAA
jgi:Na+/H+ antiporter NhaA